MKLLKPEILSNISNVEAIFTTADRYDVNKKGRIPGLNLGKNTLADSEEVNENYNKLFDKLHWNKKYIASALQVHGDNIEIINEPGSYPDTDGLITHKKNIILSIQVADCAAVLIANTKTGTIGAFHAGWKGAAKGIIKKGLKMMKDFDHAEGDYYAFISPCISQKNFEVGEEVAQKFPDYVVDRINYDKPHVDLKAFIVDELLNEGVSGQDIQVSDICTFENSEFYSYRREREKAGRMLALIKRN